ncbi:MAG: SapC family protein [Campylobacterota bacterium]|nr:SapC family protein [Campylobacterota bacterium]
MYKNVKILQPKEHGFYRYSPPQDYYFAKDANLIPITFSEVKSLCCSYPIIIIEQDDKPMLMLMTGIEHNNAVDEKGEWSCDYLPAFLRRYPFTLVGDESSDTLQLGFDLESGCFTSPNGDTLFDTDGEPSEALINAKKLLEAYNSEIQITNNILKRLKEKELLQPSQFTFKRDGEEDQKIGGFSIIDKKRLFEQDDESLLDTIKNGWMEIIELHLLSLNRSYKLQS